MIRSGSMQLVRRSLMGMRRYMASTASPSPISKTLHDAVAEAERVWPLEDDQRTHLDFMRAEYDQLKLKKETPKEILLQLEREIRETERSLDWQSLESYQLRSKGKNLIPMLALHEMPNSLYRKHGGPQLMDRMANYYHLWKDVLPSDWRLSKSSIQNIYNLSVQFRSEDAIKIASDVELNDVQAGIDLNDQRPKEWWRSNQWQVAGRGNLILPEMTVNQPFVKFSLDAEEKDEKLMTLMLIDADYPNVKDKTMNSVPLWIVGNIPTINTGCKFENGETLVTYTPPHPMQGSGFHRFCWVLLEQRNNKPIVKSDFLSQLAENKWDIKSVLVDDKRFILRGLTFHRAAWSPDVSYLYENGKVNVPVDLITHENGDETENAVDGRIVVKMEPIYGKPIDRSWTSVRQRLYRYAFM